MNRNHVPIARWADLPEATPTAADADGRRTATGHARSRGRLVVSGNAAVVLDAGGLIGVGRRERPLAALIDDAEQTGVTLVVPAPVLAQVWRGGPRQALISRLPNLPTLEVDLLTRTAWQRAGQLCGLAGMSDLVDAAVIVCARERSPRAVITSDPDDLRRLDPALAFSGSRERVTPGDPQDTTPAWRHAGTGWTASSTRGAFAPS